MFSEPEGLISKPKDWTMDELTSGNYKIVEIPVTFGCDGSMFIIFAGSEQLS